MLTPSQIRAARALLGWEALELSRRTGLSNKTISNIETAHTQPHAASIERIEAVFSEAGVEFLPNQGLRFKPSEIDLFEGPERFLDFYEIVYDHMKRHGGKICISGVDETLFAKYQTNQKDYIERVTKLQKDRDDIKVFILIREGDTNFVASKYAEYRWQNRDNFDPTPFYVFGDYLALISFQADPTPKVILIRSWPFAEAYRKQFMEVWNVATKPRAKKT
jgi:transcriptional regulator with XRE-family HTH domain